MDVLLTGSSWMWHQEWEKRESVKKSDSGFKKSTNSGFKKKN
jgi:hypothetical protein